MRLYDDDCVLPEEEAMSSEVENLDVNEDIVDLALREAVRLGRVVRSKDDEGRDVYTAVQAN